MRRYFISEMDPRAEMIARENKLDLELIDFCRVENLTDERFILRTIRRLDGIEQRTLHAPYCELFPSAIDPMARQVASLRIRQASQLCARLGVRRMIVHSGYLPRVYYPEWFIPKSIEFWMEIGRDLPPDLEIAIENVLDVAPEPLAAVCDGIDDPRFGVCLDVGHANVYSEIPLEKWIERLGTRIRHVHLHDNNGHQDQHAALGTGSVNVAKVLETLDACAPEADICIESAQAQSCLRYLKERNGRL